MKTLLKKTTQRKLKKHFKTLLPKIAPVAFPIFLGIAAITFATTVGTSISTQDISVTGNSTTTGDHSVGGNLDVVGSITGSINGMTGGNVTGTTRILGSFTARPASSTGEYNTILGMSSALLLEDGSMNACVGHACFEDLTTGSFNVQMTGYSGTVQTTGDGTTNIGGHAYAGIGDESFNTSLGYEAGFRSYLAPAYYYGEYNTMLGAKTGLIQVDDWTTLSNVDNATLVGHGASLGDEATVWKNMTAVGCAGGSCPTTGTARITAAAHGFADGTLVDVRGVRKDNILSKGPSTSNPEACILSSKEVNYFRTLAVDADHFDIQWCSDSASAFTEGGTSNWIGETCTGWTTANWNATFTNLFGKQSNFTSCYLDTVAGQEGHDTGAYVAKISSGTQDYDFTTVIGSNAIGNCSNCVTLGRTVDTVKIPGTLDAASITIDAANITGTLDAARITGALDVSSLTISETSSLGQYIRTNQLFNLQSILAPLSNTIKLILGWTDTTPSAGTEYDFSGNSNAFNYTGFVDTADNYHANGGRYLTFDNTDDQLTMADDTDFELLSNDWTIQGWIKPTASTVGTIIAKQDEWEIQQDASSRIVFSAMDASDGDDCARRTGASIALADTWYHFAIVHSGDGGTNYCSAELTFYLNGAVVTNVSSGENLTGTFTITGTAGALAVGKIPGGLPESYYGGSMGPLVVDNGKSYTAAEVLYIYNSTKALYGL